MFMFLSDTLLGIVYSINTNIVGFIYQRWNVIPVETYYWTHILRNIILNSIIKLRSKVQVI